MNSGPSPEDVVVPYRSPSEAFPFVGLTEISTCPGEQLIQRIGAGPGSVLVITGPPNAGKTSFGVSAGQHVALGEPWLGLKTKRAAVAYFAPEAPASVRLRARPAAQQFPGRTIPFFLIGSDLDLGSENAAIDTARMISTIEAISSSAGERVGLVFIDTVASALGGGQENGDGMVQLSNAAKRVAIATKSCLALIHHPPKSGEGKGLRGHGSLQGAADTILEIVSDEATGIRTATLVKSRDTATGLQIRYRLEVITMPECDPWGDPVTTVVVAPVTAAQMAAASSSSTKSKATGQNQVKAMTALREWVRNHPDESFITSDSLKALLEAHGIANRQRRADVMNFLVNAGVLTVSVGGNRINREAIE